MAKLTNNQLEMRERKWAENRITHLSAILSTINRVNELIVQVVDRECLIQQVCELLVETRGYLGSWALLRDNNGNPLFVVGAGNGEVLSILTKCMKQSNYPLCVKAILEQEKGFILYRNLGNKHRGCPLFNTCSEKTALLGKLESGVRVYGALGVSIPLRMAGDEDEHYLFRGIVSHISNAIAKIEAEKERERIETALRESEKKYRSLFNNAQVGLFRSKITNGKILECNNLYAKLMGYNTREQCIAEFVASEHYVDPNDRKQLLKQLRKSGQVTQFVGQITRIDGSPFWMSFSARIHPERGCMEGALIDISKQKQVEEQLRASRKKLRNLSTYLQHAMEEERKRVAREIHDELGQALTVLKIDLSWLTKRLPAGQELLSEKIKSMLRYVNMTTQAVRRISAELRPGVLDDLGLVAAIEWQAQQFQDTTGIVCKVSSSSKDIILNQDLATAIFRIFQEALTNIIRHANATEVKVSLKQEAGKLEFKIRDNGIGITQKAISDPKSLGLIGIKERVYYWGGEVKISGIRSEGTTVTVSIPLDERGELNSENTHRR